MKPYSSGRMLRSVLLTLFIPAISFGQTIYNANYQTINFGGSGVTIIYKVGTTGKSAGNVTLYRNVITIGGTAIDAIIRTSSISSGATMDYFDKTGTGMGYTNNQDVWFSPQFDFPSGGGQALFNFEFILGGSYNNTTNTGTSVILENVRINSYDIDGNGTNNSNQFNEFGGFFTSELATNTVIAATYNSGTGLTKFRSTVDDNVTNASDPTTRVRVTYTQLSKFALQVGSGAAGSAYFFLDFGVGPNWPATPATVTAPVLDLNTTTAGNDNAGNTCSSSVPFTAGGINITSVSSTPSGGTTLERLKISFESASILNGASEQLLINGATSGGTIALNFANAAVIPNVVLSSKTYSVTATVENGDRILVFAKNGSATMTLAEAESLLDAFRYNNAASSPSAGTRTFEVTVKDGAYESQAAVFAASVFPAPVISAQPVNMTITAGAVTVFTVSSTAVSYQWQVNPSTGTFNNISNSSMYSGALTSQLTVTGAPVSMNNYQYRTIISNGNCSVASTVSTLAISSVLPVKWSSFTAKKQQKKVLLSWSTSVEQHSRYFIVQHSTDGNHFEDLRIVAAAGNSVDEKQYSYLHTQPANGNNYYRIRQYDQDGNSTSSQVISVIYGAGESAFSVLSNPVVNGSIGMRINRSVTIYLYSPEGRLLIKKPLTPGIAHLDASIYTKGIYTLMGDNETKKILLYK